MSRLKVNVSKSHIAKGICGSPQRCAVALAILKAGKGKFKYVSVGGVYARTNTIASSIGTTSSPLPEKVRKFIDKFDTHGGRGKLSPFSFFLKAVAR